MDIQVRVPATVANLGPGFDCLGVALGSYLELAVSRSEEPEVAGVGPLRPPGRNLTYQSYLAAYRAAGAEAPPARIEMMRTYPSARGMGSSASAIVAGLVAARALGELDLPDASLARLAVSIEGHPDNVLPALFGGLILVRGDTWMRVVPTTGISPLVLVAPGRFKTEEARAAVPRQVSLEDAVANAAATAVLVSVLAGAEPPSGLMAATEDRLHEPYRLPLMPASLALHRALRDKGIAATLAGAGPSIACLVETGVLEDCRRIASELAPDRWQVLSPGWDLTGAQLR